MAPKYRGVCTHVTITHYISVHSFKEHSDDYFLTSHGPIGLVVEITRP